MPAYVYAVLVDGQSFGAQTGTLLGACRAASRQTEATSGSQDAMPGQTCIVRQLTQGATYPARGTPQTGQGRQLAIADHLAFGNLRQYQVEHLAARLRACCRLRG